MKLLERLVHWHHIWLLIIQALEHALAVSWSESLTIIGRELWHLRLLIPIVILVERSVEVWWLLGSVLWIAKVRSHGSIEWHLERILESEHLCWIGSIERILWKLLNVWLESWRLRIKCSLLFSSGVV